MDACNMYVCMWTYTCMCTINLANKRVWYTTIYAKPIHTPYPYSSPRLKHSSSLEVQLQVRRDAARQIHERGGGARQGPSNGPLGNPHPSTHPSYSPVQQAGR
ncbi:hypothetical protein EON63_16475 [archaeon]|nr:MAG: hypothetical protein EON63_16475 [archaeon]